jgi:ubiquinone/menaquinone biosynthesis C-methylase UbiE
MALGFELESAMPDLREMETRGAAERSRVRRDHVTLHQFWQDYLLGRNADIGIELMTSIAPYRDLMRIQSRELRLKSDDVVVDLGSGTGSFPEFVTSNEIADGPFRIIGVDFVREGFVRAKNRLKASNAALSFDLQFLQSNLDLRNSEACIPLASESADAVIGSLFISYVKYPEVILSEISRILKPGGRVVISSLRRDADMSKLYMEGIEELRSGLARERFGESGEREIEIAARSYLNQASKLLDLEEEGEFRFWDVGDLVEIVRAAGFRQVESASTLGSPPQAIVVSATR